MNEPPTSPVRAAIYLRISLDREMDGLAIGRQREDCESRARFRGWGIVETYIDQSLSASDKTKKRPAYLRMIAEGNYDAVALLTAEANSGEYQEPSPALSMANLEAAIKARIAYIKALPDALFDAMVQR